MLLRFGIVAGVIMLVGLASGESQLVPCSGETDVRVIDDALLAIQRSADPCGESVELIAVLERLRGCTTAYKICTDRNVSRNLFDPPTNGHSEAVPRTIVWNPVLRSELEPGCDSNSSEGPVHRDPTASLVHELVHALQDCEGLNPGEHELEAVRIENIYRRAAGLAQRRGYGADLLPPEMIKICSRDWCPCSSNPTSPASVRSGVVIGRRVGTASSGDAEPQP